MNNNAKTSNTLSTDAFYVDTPVGKLRISAKTGGPSEGYPGVFVDYVRGNGELVQLACTEFDPCEGTICTEVFPGADREVTRFAHDGLPKILAEEQVNAERATAIRNIRNFFRSEYGKETVAEFDKELTEDPNLSVHGIAYTTTTDDRLEIQADVDLDKCMLTVSLRPCGNEDWVHIRVRRYESLAEMNEKFLSDIDFESLVYIEDSEWDKFNTSAIGKAWISETFPVGTKVELIYMDDIQAPPVGTKGTVFHIDDVSQLHVRWETGSGLALNYGIDEFRVIEEVQA